MNWANIDPTPKPAPVCKTCEGCGQVTDATKPEEREPWSAWTERIPPGSALAASMGIVNPIPCPECFGPASGNPLGEKNKQEV